MYAVFASTDIVAPYHCCYCHVSQSSYMDEEAKLKVIPLPQVLVDDDMANDWSEEERKRTEVKKEEGRRKKRRRKPVRRRMDEEELVKRLRKEEETKKPERRQSFKYHLH